MLLKCLPHGRQGLFQLAVLGLHFLKSLQLRFPRSSLELLQGHFQLSPKHLNPFAQTLWWDLKVTS
jgi:hypothetical protein